MNTPKKNKSFCDDSLIYSPILLPESPASVNSQRNLTGYPRVARDIAADLYNNIQHWNSLHIKGAAIINEIAGMKSNCNKVYPEGVEILIIEMVEIIDGFRIISYSLLSSAQQLTALIKLHKSSVPLFITWTVEKMAETGHFIAKAYETEFKLKQFVVENICHLHNKDKIMFYATCWIHQPYVTNEVNLVLESFLVETGHRNIS